MKNYFFSDIAAAVRSTVLTGLSLVTSQAIAATDTVLQAFGYLQAQITSLTTTVAGKIGGSGTTNTIPKFTAGSTLGNSSRTDTGTAVTETLAVTLANLTNALNSGNYPLQFKSGVASGAGAVGFQFDTDNTLNNGKLLSMKNAGTELFKIENYTTGKKIAYFNSRMAIGSLADSVPLYPSVPALYIEEVESGAYAYGLYFDIAANGGNANQFVSPLIGISRVQTIYTGVLPPRIVVSSMILANESTGSAWASARVYEAGYTQTAGATASAGPILDLYAAVHPAEALPASSVTVATDINFFHALATGLNHYYTGTISTTIAGLRVENLRPRITYGTKPATTYGAYILTQSGGLTNNYGIQIDAPSGGSTVNEAIWINGNTAASGVLFGSSKSARIWYDGTNLVVNPKLVGSGALSILGNISLLDFNVVLGTTTGTKIGTATTQKLGFWNVTPIVQPSAFTQTYSTATKTHAALTSATLTDSTTGTADTTVADVGAAFSQATLNNNFADLIAQINALRVDLVNAKGVINAIIDDGQAEGLLA